MHPNKKVGIVESEKSAIIASAYHPDFLWLACGGSGGLVKDKIKVLEGRDVTLWPDLKQFDLWKVEAKTISKVLKTARVKVATVLEGIATVSERERGLDLADFLIRKHWKAYKENRNSS